MKKPTRTRSDAHEKRSANLFNAKINPNSGAVNNPALKGDCRSDLFLIECKCTEKASMSIKLDVLKQANRQAISINKNYVLDIEFQGESENKVLGSYILLDRDYFVEILEEYVKLKEGG